MLQAILEAVTTFGPMILLMLLPVLIPAAVETVGFITDRRKMFAGAEASEITTAAVPASRQLTQAELTKAA